MPGKTKIEWCDYVSNPLKAKYSSPHPGLPPNRENADLGEGAEEKRGHVCVKISEGCAHCWASSMNVRLGTGLEYSLPNVRKVTPFWDGDEVGRLLKFKPKGPFKGGRSRPLVFMADMTDVFGDWVRDEWLLNLRGILAWREDVDFVLLTKRPARMKMFFLGSSVLPNVWLGVSVENRQRAEERLYPMYALARAGWKTLASYEPALGRVDWAEWSFLDWLVCGGESGNQARPMAPAWARDARDFCKRNDIPFYFKQWGEFAPVTDLLGRGMTTFKSCPVNVEAEMMVKVGRGLAGHLLDGEVWRETPGGAHG